MKQLITSLVFMFSIGMIAQNQLIIPSTIQDANINLTLQNGTHQFFDGHDTATMGANGNVLGPTLIVNNGDNLNINVTNNLGEPTTIHWHGMHISALNDGGPHTIIDPGTTWNPQFTVNNKAATYWYHPHLVEKTDEHVIKGLAGLIIVRDAEEAALNLPRTYGIDDIPLVVQTKDFDVNYQVINHSNNDDTVMVNATVDPMTDVPAQVVRLRLLNGSTQRTFNFGFSGNLTFYQIATDGGLKENPLPLTRLRLSNGERTEILVDLSGMEGQTLHLMSYASELPNGINGATYPGASPTMVLNNYNPNPINGTDFNILQLNIIAQTANPIINIPTSLVNITPYLESNADENRTFSFSSVIGGQNALNGDFTINNVSMDMNVINTTIPLNNIEVWNLENGTPAAHPFHIHDIQFYILDIDGSSPPAYLQGWKDTVLLRPGQVIKVITKFEDFADETIPYMYHCHMLTHEDGGMMGQFVVINENAGVNDVVFENGIKLYPNPSDKIYMTVKIQNQNEKITAYAVINNLGQIISYNKIHGNEINNLYSFPIFEYSSGIYTLKIYTDKNIYTKKFIKK